MKITTIYEKKYKIQYLFPFLLTILVLPSLTIFAQTPELSLVDIFTALRSNKASIDEKNNILAQGVQQRGVTFGINATLENELRNAGANDDLILAIYRKTTTAPPKVEPKTPKVEPTPKPDPTPSPTPSPPDFSFYQSRGNSNYVLGEYVSAVKDYNEAVKLNEKEPNLYLSRGLAFYNMRQFRSAASDFSKAIELDPNESMAYYNRGNALQELGEFEKALIDYETASKLDSENEPAKNAFEKLRADLKVIQPAKTIEQGEKSTAEVKETKESTNNVNPDTPVSISNINDVAVNLANPVYPQSERNRGLDGLVSVRVEIDKEGKVVSAKAISGPSFLRRPSEIAAKRSKFKPYTIDGKPVIAIGYITYNFKLK